MRINKYLAQATGMSRRAADRAITEGRIRVNNQSPHAGQQVIDSDVVTVDGHTVTATNDMMTIMLNKPVGYVCSRNGQGSQTVYNLLPKKLHSLKPVGRLDKASSGLLLLTNDGELANQLTHPRYAKTKIYEVTLGTALAPLHQQFIAERGIQLEDGPSRLQLEKQDEEGYHWRVTMQEGRNRQIRRTFAALGYTVNTLHRITFGGYKLNELAPGTFCTVNA